jgi:hypothetical protein
MTEWLTADIAWTISKFLGFKDYVNLLSTCRLTHQVLSAEYASRAHPHALKHMSKLIEEERRKTVDSIFKFETLWHGPTMVFVNQDTDNATQRSYYQIKVMKDYHTNLNTIQISVNRRSFTPEARGEVLSFPIGFSQAVISPSFERPFQSGKIYSVGYAYSHTRKVVRQYYKTVEYNDGFHGILATLACDLCPLTQACLPEKH